MESKINSIGKNADICSAEVSQTAVPSQFVGKPYYELFNDFVLNRSFVPLGLFRCKDAQSAPDSYVLTNPGGNTRVHAKDLVYILKIPAAKITT
jgi:hypothetical protein